MKKLSTYLLGFVFWGSLQAQELPDLPPYFDYVLQTDTMLIMERDKEHYYLLGQEKSFSLGCHDALSVEIAFSLLLDNDFLFDQYPGFMAELYQDAVSPGFELILYGVRKQGAPFDSLFRERIEDYCIYGQHNYWIESQDYFIFTYQYAMNGGGTIAQYEKYGIWQELTKGLVNWLNSHELQDFALAALSNDSLVGSDFDWRGDYLMYPRDSVLALESLAQLQAQKLNRAGSPRRLELKSNHRARNTSNYKEPRANWFVDKAKWWRHQNLIYVWVEGWGLQVYRIVAPGVLLNLRHNFAFIRKD